MATKTAVKKSRKQAKHKTPKLLAAVLAVGIAVALTYYLIQKPNNTNNNTTTTPTTQPAQNIPDQTTTKEPLPSTDEYLEIKEWSVRFKLPPELRGDVYYVMSADGVTVRFGSKRLAAINLACGAEPHLGVVEGLGILYKQVAGSAKADYSPESFKTIRGEDYYYLKNSSDCVTTGTKNPPSDENVSVVLSITIATTLEAL